MIKRTFLLLVAGFFGLASADAQTMFRGILPTVASTMNQRRARSTA